MSETIEELKAALASEKAARLKAEAEHDKWCKVADEALTRARTAEADVEQARKELRAWAANGDYTINLGIATATERLQKERDEARAACAEMRNALEHPDEVCTRLRALSTSSGTGWLSPETIKEFIDSEVTDDEGAIVNARDHGEWDRLKYLEGHKAGLLWVKHHVQALAALKGQP